MKKILVALLAASVIFLTGCSPKTTVKGGVGIPSNVSEIKFYNGGACILDTEGQPAKVVIKIETNYKVVGNNISFYVYHISWKDKSGNHHSKAIMDSESLTAIWDDEDYE